MPPLPIFHERGARAVHAEFGTGDEEAQTMSESSVLEQSRAMANARLLRPREEAISFLQNQLKKGSEIKAMRIRSATDLDHARAQKLEWTNVTTELLKDLFDDSAVAEECNDWVGKIYPEFAEFGNFVEQFYAEMEHRLKRLKVVIKHVQKMPSPETRASAPAAGIVSTTPSHAPAPAPLLSHVETPSSLTSPPSSSGSGSGSSSSSSSSSSKSAPRQHEVVRGMLLIFGGEESSRTVLADFLDSLDVEITVVDATSGKPHAITEALDQARDASFALIMTGEQPQDRSFELGFCVGRLGLKRVCVVHSPGAHVQADARGLAHVVLDLSGGWQLVLARYLKRAGLGVDLNRLC
jgi:hypothetical protein